MAKRRKRKAPRSAADPLDAYRRIRKPVPPPQRVERDERRRIDERDAERDAERDRLEARQPDEGGR
jgi:hypothetical protein